MTEYEFSAPMPFYKNNIDKISDINNQITKSKIKSLYFGLPQTCNMFTGFEQNRNTLLNQTSFDYWKDLMSYSLFKGFDIIYLLNNPMPISINDFDFNNKINKLDKLLKELKKLGITKLRIANLQLSGFISKKYPEFTIYASTSLDYHTISEYQNLVMFHPEIKQIIPSHDVNKNFKLLKNIKINYPKLEIELMVNEGCMQGCPHRNLHEMIAINDDNSDFYFSVCRYCTTFCNYIAEKFPFHSLTIATFIYPWDLVEYKKLGIKNFKLVGRDIFTFKIEEYINQYFLYLKTIDNYSECENIPINTFVHHINEQPKLLSLNVKEVKKYLPGIKHFKKYGHLCASRCGVECRYCYKCAEKIEKIYIKKNEEQRKRTVPVCKVKD